MITRVLVLCSGAEALGRRPSGDDRQCVELESLGPQTNVSIKIENVTLPFAQSLSGRLEDLLDIAAYAYVYAADCATERDEGVGDDDNPEVWSRNLRLVIPVRDLAFWQQDDVVESLTEALEFLSSDEWSFEFRPLTKKREKQPFLKLGREDLEAFTGVERVLMFSGGLDSLAGAAETAADGRSLVLVSHYAVDKVRSVQRELFHELKTTFQVPMIHIPVRINKKTGLARDYTQRTRSLLFSAIGTIVAEHLRAGGVRFFENGVTSLNLPIADEIQRSRASRTTHPKALRLLERLFQLVTEREFFLDNPYVFQTKTEVVSIVADKGASSLISKTCSCSRTMFRSNVQRHCGACSQCLD